jgi:DNA repair exonuclease SbcCD ATPase subunit
MENTSFENISSSDTKKFFRHICIATSRFIKKEHAISDLKRHLERINQNSKIAELKARDIYQLKTKINKILKTRKRLSEHRNLEGAGEKQLRKKIHQLENELDRVKEERDTAQKENKDKIVEMNSAISSLKTRMSEIVYKKLKELE